jgi:calpain-15
MDSI